MSRSFIFTNLISYSTVRSPSKLLYNMLLNRSIHTLLFIGLFPFFLFFFFWPPQDRNQTWATVGTDTAAAATPDPLLTQYGQSGMEPTSRCHRDTAGPHCATSRSSWIIFVEEIFNCGITEQNSVNIFGFICTLKLDLCPTCYAVLNGRLYLLLSYFIKCHLLI